jgi:hypothetical protein
MDVAKAVSQLRETIAFRRRENVPDLRADMFPPFLSRGDLYIGGFAPSGEPVLVRIGAPLQSRILNHPNKLAILPWSLATCLYVQYTVFRLHKRCWSL